MVPGLVGSLRQWLSPSPEEDYEVSEYVLNRSGPDPENRIREYDSPVDSEAVEAEASLPAGTYLLQEVKPSGMAGDVVWEEELDPR